MFPSVGMEVTSPCMYGIYLVSWFYLYFYFVLFSYEGRLNLYNDACLLQRPYICLFGMVGKELMLNLTFTLFNHFFFCAMDIGTIKLYHLKSHKVSRKQTCWVHFQAVLYAINLV